MLCGCALLSPLPTAAAQNSVLAPAQGEQRSPPQAQGKIQAAPRTPAEYRSIRAAGRFQWFARSTAGPISLVGGIFAAGLGTAIDAPSEYGPHWEGFGKRYGMRLTGISTGNAIEATLGSAWREDPRYFSTIDRPFGSHVKNIVDLTFRAYGGDGKRHLAPARYTATFGNNLLSNSWRAPSEANWQHAFLRTAEGFGARALSNTFDEFMPQVTKKLHNVLEHRSDSPRRSRIPSD